MFRDVYGSSRLAVRIRSCCGAALAARAAARRALRTLGFENALFAAARETARCEHVTAFAFTGAEPRMVVAVNAAQRPVARQVGAQIRSRLLETRSRAQGAGRASRPAGDPHPRRGHRQRRLPARLLHRRRIVRPDSLVSTRNDETLRLNFYKSSCNGCFADEEIDHLLGAAELMMSLLAEHDAGIAAGRAPMPR